MASMLVRMFAWLSSQRPTAPAVKVREMRGRLVSYVRSADTGSLICETQCVLFSRKSLPPGEPMPPLGAPVLARVNEDNFAVELRVLS